MAKYIDAEEIFFSYKEEEVAAQYDGKNDITSGVLFVLDTISEMPESIVRCKDCIFRPTTKGDVYGTDVEFPYEGMCPLQCEDPYYNQMMDGDFFCANGERRSE